MVKIMSGMERPVRTGAEKGCRGMLAHRQHIVDRHGDVGDHYYLNCLVNGCRFPFLLLARAPSTNR